MSRSVARFGIIPLVVAVALGSLYLWISGLQLDSIEQRNLTVETLSERTLTHVWLTAASSVLVVAIAVPLGVLVTRPGFRKLAPAVLAVGNGGQAAPVIGVLLFIAAIWETGFWPAVLALVIYASLSVVRNTIVGVEGVSPATIDAARGLGMSKLQILVRVELPLAVPVILAGVRTALILLVGSATLATFIGAGGLGELITTGQKLNRLPVLLAGGIITACLALTIDWIASIVETVLTPRGFRVESAR